jgi:hypothetical protein
MQRPLYNHPAFALLAREHLRMSWSYQPPRLAPIEAANERAAEQG